MIYQTTQKTSTHEHRRRVLSELPEPDQGIVRDAAAKIEERLKLSGARFGPNSALELLESLGMLLVAEDNEIKLDLRMRYVIKELLESV